MLEKHKEALVAFLKAKTFSTELSIDSMKRLSGGAIQENWLLVVSILDGDYIGQHEWVLRCDSSTSLSDSLSREQEFILLQHADAASVTVAKPLWLGEKSVFGKSFFVMHKVDGVTRPAHLLNENKFTVDRKQLVEDLACELAKIHSIKDNESLNFLIKPNIHPAKYGLDQFLEYLDSLSEIYPILEWAIRYMQNNLPDCDDLALSHRDFRVGNLMVAESGLTAVLDWEFCEWSDFHEDIAWFCAPCWRFSRRDLEAGGLASREVFYTSYEKHSQKKIDSKKMLFWEMYATLRWAIIAIKQGHRHLSKEEASLELALTAHIVPELEFDLINMLKQVAA